VHFKLDQNGRNRHLCARRIHYYFRFCPNASLIGNRGECKLAPLLVRTSGGYDRSRVTNLADALAMISCAQQRDVVWWLPKMMRTRAIASAQLDYEASGRSCDERNVVVMSPLKQLSLCTLTCSAHRTQEPSNEMVTVDHRMCPRRRSGGLAKDRFLQIDARPICILFPFP
jgi:hypothetical protein